MTEPPTPTLDRLEDQIDWYDGKAVSNERSYKTYKALQLLAAAAIPVVATLSAHAGVSAALGGVVLVLEGFQQLNQYQSNWINYRSTCEALKHEKFLYLASAGPYSAGPDSLPALAERVEGLISTEHAKWVKAAESEVSPSGAS